FTFEDGSRNTDISSWEHHRNDIKSYLEYYEIGQKPSMKDMKLKARLDGNKLTVTVTNPQGTSIDLTATITWPKKADHNTTDITNINKEPATNNNRLSQLQFYGSEQKGDTPVPALIGISCTLPVNLFLTKGCALVNFDFNTVCKHQQTRGEEPINKLYPDQKSNGAYSYWAWGISRIIDGLQQLGSEVTGIDTRHLAVSGCSWAGKAALWSGALDERICLVIPQEPGGGGVASWRVSETLGNVETIGRTDGHWFLESMIKDFGNGNVSKLPIDHHQLVAMVAPRALLMFGNTDYEWLADESAYVSMQAARRIYKTLGIPDRIGFVINGKHMHCLLPENEHQYLTAYIDRFLLGKDVPTDFAIAPSFESVDYMKWIKW
ncbi:MAG: glycoside hydrolase, partial [Bacteroidaceae bacterium]|nr:glycoside hydrolase [Bacteroidaceae bacterium]